MRSRFPLSTIPIAIGICWVLSPIAAAADWPFYRGDSGRTAVSPETGLLKAWPAGGPPVAWKLAGLGETRSSPVVAGGVVYTSRGNRALVALDARTGAERWQVGFGWRDSTPAVSDGRIVFCDGGKDGRFTCLSTADGRELWHFDVTSVVPHARELGCKYVGWAQSPLVVDGKVIVVTGAKETPVIALSLEDGSVAWQAGPAKLAFNRSYASPVLGRRGETPLLITHFATVVAGLDARDGRILWERKVNDDETWRKRGKLPLANCSQVFGDLLLCVSSRHYGGPIKQSAFTLSADGTALTPAWHNPIVGPHQEGFLVYDGNLYGSGQVTWHQAMTTEGFLIDGKPWADWQEELAKDVPPGEDKRTSQPLYLGDRHNSTGLVCQDARTGALRGIRFGMPLQSWGGFTGHLVLAADGRLIVTGTANQRLVWLVEPGPAMKVVGSIDNPVGTRLDRKTKQQVPGDLSRWSSPALADGFLFMRLNDDLVVYDLREPGD